MPDPVTTGGLLLQAKTAKLSGAHAVLTWRLCALGGHHKGFRFDARSQPGATAQNVYILSILNVINTLKYIIYPE